VNRFDLSLISIRGLGLWFIATGIAQMPTQLVFAAQTLLHQSDSGTRFGALAALTQVATTTLVGVFLWNGATRMSQRIFDASEKAGIIDGVDGSRLGNAAVMVVGTFVAVPALGNLGESCLMIVYGKLGIVAEPWVRYEGGSFNAAVLHGPIADFGIRFVIGLCMILFPTEVVSDPGRGDEVSGRDQMVATRHLKGATVLPVPRREIPFAAAQPNGAA